MKIENPPFEVTLHPTGLATLDLALGGGVPLRSLIGISGHPSAGKTTLCLHLAGKIMNDLAGENARIFLAAIEQVDPLYARIVLENAGFTGTLVYIPTTGKDGKPRPAEEVLTDLVAEISSTSIPAASILDSVGSLVPEALLKGAVAEAQVGLVARLMARFSRAISYALASSATPGVAFYTAHVHEEVGGRGVVTGGGVVKEYLSAVLMRVFQEKAVEGVGFIVKGTILKSRFRPGFPKTFRVFLTPRGPDAGATAILYLIDQGLAEEDRTVKIDGKSFGYLKNLLENPPAELVEMAFADLSARLQAPPASEQPTKRRKK